MQHQQKRGQRRGNKPQKSQSPATKTTVEGDLRLHPRGFGFIEKRDTSTREKTSYFVPGTMLAGILDGDVVKATVETRDGNNQVRSVHTVKRARTRIVGTWLGDSISIDPGMGLGEWPARGYAQNGETVVAEWRDGEWLINERLGDTYDENVLARRFLERHQLPHEHDQATIKEATLIAGAKRKKGTRRNFSNDTVITIDADHSKDLDDAVSVKIEGGGFLRLYVHIADVAEHVQEDSLMDKAAQTTPTSVYLPMMVRPMLPTQISEQALSLLPGVERDTLTVEMLIDSEGNVVKSSIYESVIVSTQRVSYVNVAKYLRGDLVGSGFGPNVAETVGWLWHAAQRVGIQRNVRGGVPSNLIGEDPSDEDDAHLLVERLMVQANETVAEWLEARDLPALYRCHGAPEEDDVRAIETTACELGQYVSFSRPVSPLAFRAFYQQIENSRDLPALRDLLAGALGSAEYTTVNYGHFGLGSVRYVHFTSPLRRYADLLVHRVIKKHLRSESTRRMRGVLERMETHISDVSTRAGKAEREARVAIALREIETKQVRLATGTIRGISDTKIRVEAEELGDVGGYVMVRKLDGWRFDEARHEGRSNGKVYKVGAKVDVKAIKIDALRGSLEFTFHSDGRAATKTDSRGKRSGKRTRRRR